jgi:small conductance mechanosensitive channel
MNSMNSTYFEEKFESIKKQTIDIAPTIIISIIIFIVFYVMASYIKNVITTNKKNQTGINQESEKTILNELNTNLVFYQLGWILYYSVIIIGIIFALVNLGFNVGTILTILGTLGLALGLALQETLKNIISGIYLAVINPYGLSDLVSIKPLGNTNPIIGRVYDFNLYYTSLLDTSTNQITIIPNSTIQNNLVTNLSKTI